MLAAIVALYFAGAYREVQKTARAAATERVRILSSDLSQLLNTGTSTRSVTVARWLSTPGFLMALAGGPQDSALSVLTRLRAGPDSLRSISLLDAAQQPLLKLGLQPSPLAQAELERTLRSTNEMQGPNMLGRLFIDNGRANFWTIYPVPDAEHRLGYVTQLRTLGGPVQTEALRRLIGTQNTVLFANAHGEGPWVRLDGTYTDPPKDYDSEGKAHLYTRADTTFISQTDTVPNTSWIVVVETPEALTRAPAFQFLRRTGPLGLGLILLGAVFAWLISRRLVRPLRDLGRAAESIAEGRYKEVLDVQRSDELGAVALAFNHMAAAVQQAVSEAESSRAEAERASRAKSEFLATMSHEIRTPINAMLGYADLLELGIGGPVTPEQRAQLARIRLSGQHLNGLINDLLDFARLETGNLKIRPAVAQAELTIKTALTVIEPPASAKAIDLHVEADAEVSYLGDPQRVEQILVNLLDNAVKFTPQGGSVTLRCHTVEREGKLRTRFVVEDTGIGIAPDQIESMFEAFVQGTTGYTRSHGGSGLGLAISRRLAHLMSGEITVESERGKGARFVLDLPAPAEAFVNYEA